MNGNYLSMGQCKNRRNPIALAMELHLSCTNPSILNPPKYVTLASDAIVFADNYYLS